LLQRPIIVKGKKAIIGRPKDRIKELLSWSILNGAAGRTADTRC
jgi:hypothetical protein